MIQENTRKVASGYLALVVLPALTLLLGWMFIRSATANEVVSAVFYMLGLVITLICYKGFFMVHPNQAQAIVAARRQIVDGAVGMVKMALTELEEQNVVQLDEERKANMVSNLLVVLCGEENAQPVLNTGSLYN